MSTTTTPEPPACMDCDAEKVVTVCSIARLDGGRAPIDLIEIVHASSCPVLRGVI